MKALCWNNSNNFIIESFSGNQRWNPDDAIVRIMSSMHDLDLHPSRMLSVTQAGYLNGDVKMRNEEIGSAAYRKAQQRCVQEGSIIGCGVCSYSTADYCSHYNSSDAIVQESTHSSIAGGIFGYP